MLIVWRLLNSGVLRIACGKVACEFDRCVRDGATELYYKSNDGSIARPLLVLGESLLS